MTASVGWFIVVLVKHWTIGRDLTTMSHGTIHVHCGKINAFLAIRACSDFV